MKSGFRFLFFLALSLSLSGIAWAMGPTAVALADSPIYVRPGGDNTLCNGTVDVDYSAGVAPNCAVQTIQQGITLVDPGGTVYVAAGTYTEQVTIGQGLTLEGSGVGTTVISGTNTGRGIYLLDLTQGVTVTNLTVQHFQDGIVFGTYTDVITDVAIVDVATITNTRHGILSNAQSLTNITLQRVDASFNGLPGSSGRGVFFQSSGAVRNHVTIADGTFNNNLLAGIDLNIGQARDVVITGNTVTHNGDAGIGVLGAFSALIDDNVVTDNGRFGIEIKNPDGDGTMTGPNRIVISNNVVSRTGPPASDLRDLGGIVVIRRDVVTSDGNPDIPSGVIVISNTISGYQQPSDHEGFGIVVEGTEMRVEHNTLQNNEVGIQVQAGNVGYPGSSPTGTALTPQANTAYFDRGNSPIACIVVEDNTFSDNTVDSANVGPTGIPSVTNIDTNIAFCAIQPAIDDVNTLDGHTILAPAGAYTETLDITKSITLSGELGTIIYPDANIPSFGDVHGGAVVWIQAPNVTIQNLTVDGDNPAISGGNAVYGSDVNAFRGIYMRDTCYDGALVENVTLQNLARGVNFYCGHDHVVRNNLVRYLGGPDDGNHGYGILMMNDTSAQILNNEVMTLTLAGVFMQNNHSADDTLISGNVVTNAGIGLGWNMLYGGAHGVVEHNTVYGAGLGMQVTSIQIGSIEIRENNVTLLHSDNEGFYVWNTYSGTTSILSNTLSGGNRGIWLADNDADFGLGQAYLTLSGNDIDGASIGVEASSVSPNHPVSLVATGNAISNSSEAGMLLTGTEVITAVIGGSLADANVFAGNAVNISVTLPYTNPDVLATYNDWGVTALADIEAAIHHQVDDAALAEVLYYTISADAEPPSVLADGSSFAVVTATLGGLYAPAGHTVDLTTTLGALSALGGATDGSGNVVVTIHSTLTGLATITATAGYQSAVATVDFGASPLDHFSLSPVADQVAGVDFAVTITAEDSLNGVVMDYNGYAALADASGALAPATVGPFVDGVWSGLLTITSAWVDDVLTATHPISAGISGSSNPFTVTHNVAAAIALAPDPETATAGESVTYTVTASDAYGNDWDATGAAVYAITPGAGGSWLDNVYSAALAGSWTVTATLGDLDDTAALTVSPGAAASFTFAAIADQLTGEPFTVTITALDAFGNTATGFTGPATLTDTTGTIAPAVSGSFVDGVWSGAVTIDVEATGVVITATAGAVSGSSAPFDVIQSDFFIYLPFVVRNS